MPKQVDRTELLSRWSEIAPEECNKSTFINQSESGVWAFNGGAYVSPGRFFPAILLAALIEAVRARGWHYELMSDLKDGHTSEIFHSYYDNAVGKATAAEPCDALLLAYVSSLQARSHD